MIHRIESQSKHRSNLEGSRRPGALRGGFLNRALSDKQFT